MPQHNHGMQVGDGSTPRLAESWDIQPHLPGLRLFLSCPATRTPSRRMTRNILSDGDNAEESVDVGETNAADSN
jgi:hypothetical protein